MGTVNVSVGDTVNVMRRGMDAKYEVVENEGDIEFQRRALPCEACGNTLVEFDTVEGLNLCVGCISRALTFTVVAHVVENIGEYDIAIGRAVTALDNYDRKVRGSCPALIDTHSAAMDAMVGDSPAQIQSKIWDAIGPALRVVLPGPLAE